MNYALPLATKPDYTPYLWWVKCRTISRCGCSLAFCAAVLKPVTPRRLREPALKSADEAGGMFVANGVGNFLDAQVAVGQQIGRPLEPVFGQHLAHTDAGLLFEQMLEARGAKVDLVR